MQWLFACRQIGTVFEDRSAGAQFLRVVITRIRSVFRMYLKI